MRDVRQVDPRLFRPRLRADAQAEGWLGVVPMKVAFSPEDRHPDGGPRSGYWWARRKESRPEGDPWYPEIVQVARDYHFEFVPAYRTWQGKAHVLEVGRKRKWAIGRFELLERVPKLPEHLEIAHRALESKARESERARDAMRDLPKAVLA
jgi:hypothetical protein